MRSPDRDRQTVDAGFRCEINNFFRPGVGDMIDSPFIGIVHNPDRSDFPFDGNADQMGEIDNRFRLADILLIRQLGTVEP